MRCIMQMLYEKQVADCSKSSHVVLGGMSLENLAAIL